MRVSYLSAGKGAQHNKYSEVRNAPAQLPVFLQWESLQGKPASTGHKSCQDVALVPAVVITSRHCNFTWFYFFFCLYFYKEWFAVNTSLFSNTTWPPLLEALPGQPRHLIGMFLVQGCQAPQVTPPGDSAPGRVGLLLLSPVLASRGACE